jgi:glucose/arabinose dehydrogenase
MVQSILVLQSQAAVDWPTVSFELAVTNRFVSPSCIAHAGDGSSRLFVAEQAGVFWAIKDGAVVGAPFLDITNRVLTAGGVLGMAFSPGFTTNGRIYVCYVRQADSVVVVSRFVRSDTNASLIDAASEALVMSLGKSFNATNTSDKHDGGQLAFGPDGYLYVGAGTGTSDNYKNDYAQDPKSLKGKLLRIDVDGGASSYSVPGSNPFASNTAYAPEIWALGVRNPQSLAFDAATGALYFGDAGYGYTDYQEINFQPAGASGGANYGWRIMQGYTNRTVPTGFTNFSALTAPVIAYNLDDLSYPYDCRTSVVGGCVNGESGEPRMHGIYFYGDLYNGLLWGLKFDGDRWRSLLLYRSTNFPTTRIYTRVIGADQSGRVFAADASRGNLYRLVDTHRVWTPAFQFSTGNVTSNTVPVSCNTTNAEIHYTTNGADPTLSDPMVLSGSTILVTTARTNKLRAFRADLQPSDVVTAVYTNMVGTPVFSPAAGAFTNGTRISISTVTPGAVIWYTTNGTAPTNGSPVYTAPIPFEHSLTLKAIGVAGGYSNSPVASASYSQAAAATPVFSPSAGPVSNRTALTITCATAGSTIYYTIDGSAPTTNSAIYSGAFLINGGTTVKAFSVANSYANSSVKSVSYQLVQTATPVFSVASGRVPYGTLVAITCATPGAILYVTTDGTTPTASSAVYTQPLVVSNDITVGAFGVCPEHLDSGPVGAAYYLTQPESPVFTPAQGPLTNGQPFTIQSPTLGALVRYTLDGSEPNINSPVLSSPFLFTNALTVSARAFREQMDPSDVVSVYYGLLDYANTVVTTLAGSTNAGFVDGPGDRARFSAPLGICIDNSGYLYVADSGNNAIRSISPSGQVSTVAGTGVAGATLGVVSNAQFSGPTGVCRDTNGNLFVADSGNQNRICRIGTNGIVDLVAFVRESYYGPGLGQIVADSDGNLYVGSWATVRRVSTNAAITQLAGSGMNCSDGWCGQVGPSLDLATNVYAATEYRVWRVFPSGSVEVYAGGTGGYSDGGRLLARFMAAQDTFVDSETNVFVTDQTSVRKILTSGQVCTLAGGALAGYRNGVGRKALFSGAAGVCMDSKGNLYVADTANNCIRKIAPDSAGIGIADDWQVANFGHVGIDPNGDPDKDGVSNYYEFWAGTDPQDRSSALKVARAALSETGRVRLLWPTAAGKVYAVQCSTDLVSWANVGSFVTGDGTTVSFEGAGGVTADSRKFYRVVLIGF